MHIGYDPEFGKGNDMFKDIALSRDLLEEYRHQPEPTKEINEDMSTTVPEPKKEINGDMSTMVLKTSTWPFAKYEGQVLLPKEVSEEWWPFDQSPK